MISNKDVIIACDFANETQCHEFLKKFQNLDRKPFLKIGMELFYGAGPQLVKILRNEGFKIFLDLKLHDIPNTVKKAMRVLSQLNVDMVNVHAAGTIEMMKAAREGLTREDGTKPLLIAVTQLTSTSEETMKTQLLIDKPIDATIAHYASNAQKADLDGVVCSPLEVEKVKLVCGPDFITVTPGIRFKDSASDDQKRITDPATARLLGSDFIVVGRPITEAPDPVAAYQRCINDFLKPEDFLYNPSNFI